MEQKRVLLLIDHVFGYEAEINGMKEAGLDVVMAGAERESGFAVDDAIKRLEDGEHFDMIISRMLMSFKEGNLSLGDTNSGWKTGKAFAQRIRKQNIDTPILFYDASTSMTHCEGYKESQGTVTLGQGEEIPVLINSGNNAAELVIEVNEMLGNPPAALTDENDFSL